MTHTGGETARYEYDPAGNITKVERYPSTRLSLVSVVPMSARRGETVTVHGTGFSTDPAANTVKIGGAPMPVSKATATTLTLTIPAMSGTGPVTVQVGASTVTGPVFTLTPGAPSVTRIEPDSGPPGTEAVVTGLGFDTTPTDNVVSINGVRTEVTAASVTSLTIRIPRTTSGRLRVETPNGTFSGPDFFVPSVGVNPDLIESWDRVYPGSSRPVRIDGAGHASVVLFSAPDSGMASVGLTGLTFAAGVEVSLFDPDGVPVPGAGRTEYGQRNIQIDMTGLRPGPTYQLLVMPRENRTGALTAHLSEPVTGVVTTTGAAVPASLAVPGQDLRLAFDGTAGQALSLGLTGSTLTEGWNATVLRPDGTKLIDSRLGIQADDSIDLGTLAATGRYTLVLDPRYAGMGAVTTTLSARVDAGVATITGTAVNLVVTRAGQDAVFSFTGASGARLNLGVTDNQFDRNVEFHLFDPADPERRTIYSSTTLARSADSIRLPALSATGTYAVRINPQRAGTGQLKVTLSAPIDGGALTTTGKAAAATIGRPGQDIAFTFDAAQGDALSIGVTGNTFSTNTRVVVLGPTGASVHTAGVLATSYGNIDLPALTAAGRHTVLFRSDRAATGTAQLILSARLDAGELSVGGAVRTVAVTRRGQNARLTFNRPGTAQFTLGVVSNGLTDYTQARLIEPDGVERHLPSVRDTDVAMPDLTKTGTHQLILDPHDGVTGELRLRLLARQPTGRAAAPVSTPAARPASRRAPQTPAPPPAGDDLTWTPDRDNLLGKDWSTRRPAVAAPRPLRAKKGTTALSGHTYTIDGMPLAGVTVTAGGAKATTDRTGRFLLTGLPAGATTFTVDGTAAGPASRTFGVYTVRADVRRGRTTVLPYTIWMQALDTQHTVKLASPTTAETVLTTPKIPGLEIRIPAGSVVRDAAGNVVTELGITPIPVDRAPFPIPPGSAVPVYFTVQPGGTFVFPDGAQVIYPNQHGLRPGAVVDFESYDPEGTGWHVYGTGTVSKDGRQIVPDGASRIWSFQMFSAFKDVNLGGWDLGIFDDLAEWLSGDPVDLSTGMMVDSHTDLTVPDVTPLAVTRNYFQGDTRPREFGVGQSSQYHIFLRSATNNAASVDLYLPGGKKVHFARTTPGTAWAGVAFAADAVAGEWRGAVLQCLSDTCFGGPGWKLTRRDGTKLFFPWGPNAVSAIEDRHGNRTTITRGPNLNVADVRSSNGKWLSFTHDEAGRITTARDSGGRVVTYGYDATGRLASVAGPGTRSLSYTYDAAGRLRSATDARGVTYLTNEFDDGGRVRKQILTDGQVYEFRYTIGANGRITATEVTQPNTAVRRVTFNAVGAVLTDTQAYGSPLAQTTTYERNGQNVVTAVTDHGGRRTTYTYDDDGNLRQATALAGTADAARSGVYGYGGPFGQPLTYTDQSDKVTTFAYEADGDLKSVEDPLGRVTRYAWTGQGQLKTVTDPAGRTTTLHYRDGDLTSVTDHAGRATRQFVDALGRPSRVVDPAGSVTRVVYDALNQVRQVVDPLGNVTKLDYDANGNLERLTDPRNKINSWTYDHSDRLRTWTDPLNAVVRRDYGPQWSTATSRTAKTTRVEHDLLDRVRLVSSGVVGNTAESTITPTYDDLGRLKTLSDTAAAGVTTFDYDKLDRIERITKPEGVTSYTYRPTGEVRTATAGGQGAVEYRYDAAGAREAVVRGAVQTTLGYDAGGDLTTVTLPGGWTETVARDTIGRVTGLTYKHNGATKGALTYGYDAAGRIASTTGSLAKVALPAARTATYDDGNRLRTVGPATIAFDADGNLRTDGARTYTWNARGQLTAITGGGTAGFTYGPAGERTGRTVAGAATTFLTERGQPAVEQRGAAATSLLAGGTDRWFHRSEDGGRAYLTDLAGSTIALGDAAGALRTQYSYDPFGAAATTGDASTNAFTYTGREDDGTGLMYYRARYYSPALQRFVSEDPIGFAGGGNLYAYAANSPTNYTDPSGNNPLLVGCLLGGLTDGAMEWAGQRLSGRKVDWGWGGVGGAAALGCAAGAAGAWFDAFLDGAKATKGLGSCAVNSFTGDTLVVMADGTRRPIADVKAGDRVLATPDDDVRGGRSEARTVQTVIVGDGEKNLVHVSTDGGGTLTATDGHPFWVQDLARWVTAAELRNGQWLRTSAGTFVQVTAIERETRNERVHNLTVEDFHTYYVVAGAADVLVHNCGPTKIRNGHLAGGHHDRTKVPFDQSGFPDFSGWRHPDVQNDVFITPTYNRARDAAAANKQMGWDKTPAGYKWHHHQEKGRMQLIEEWVHDKTGHTGGFSLWD
ncbi:RHS repeat-associated core domain-containing protein [Spirilliplanes yamanashiensis]|uniref:Hint domain-containing protein n=1 Tax=Spirilliplanes yamanashiensis TaxID=42233 RepID=A0A8J3YCE2_9ACTN|nr:RHS repeat-associated protein [Spirilliplanes yamanashiensis]GIJ05192.1 hypothetical protein Sya03_45440 [Spirilliplanes yamanashiensis]